MQQLICASATKVKLSFSTFGNKQYESSLLKLLKGITKFKLKTKDLYKLIIDFKGNYDEEFHNYLQKQLGDKFDIDREEETPMFGFINGIFTLL